MTLEFLAEVRVEAAGAVAYYEQSEAGLGERFGSEVEDTARAILAQPLVWRLRRGGYRRANLMNFPYYLAYVLREDKIFVVALAHGARMPGYFRERLSQPPNT